MNRDQWKFKMRREIETVLGPSDSGKSSTGAVMFDRRRGSDDRRVAPVDRRRMGNRRLFATGVAFGSSIAEKYGACCEWGLSLKTKRR